ncbi:MAG TPA: M48 family metallopeptidase [Candidatus Paceibacterota bacterium]|nr:M48 family metallopeptidase [Candidatus Paceibacterota bacterium]
MAENLYTHQDANVRKTWLFMTAMFLVLIALGWVLAQYYGEPTFLYVFAGFSVVGNIVAYWKSDSIALAMSGARPVSREENVRLYRIVENLCITAGLPLPRLYVMHSPQINAFATGRNPEHSAIAVTTGTLEKLNDNELTGVLAHELSHIGNRDILISTVVVVMAGIIAVVSDLALRMTIWGGGRRDERNNGGAATLIVVLVAVILAPLAATLIRLAVSRKREYMADSSGALLTRYPEGLAAALEKIAQDQQPMRKAHNATAHLFIASPFKGKEAASWFTKLFATHPPLAERIRVLRGAV